MNDRDGQSYFVLLVKWVKNSYKAETPTEMVAKGIPPKKILRRGVPPYISDPTTICRQSIKAYVLANPYTKKSHKSTCAGSKKQIV